MSFFTCTCIKCKEFKSANLVSFLSLCYTLAAAAILDSHSYRDATVRVHVKLASHTAKLFAKLEKQNNSPPCAMVKWCEGHIPHLNLLDKLSSHGRS